MKRAKKTTFIAVLPAMLLAACPKSEPTKNPPPEHTMNPPPQTTPASTQEVKQPVDKPQPKPDPAEMKFPPASYSERKKKPDGACYVDVYVNPPYQAKVSCTAPIEPAPAGSEWCLVESQEDPKRKVNVKCEPKK